MNSLLRTCWMAAAVLFVVQSAHAQIGKCCLPDGRGCRNVSQEQCESAGGVFIAGQLCANPDDTCDPPLSGACCPTGGGVCTTTLSTACNGQFFPNSACSPTICQPPATGACCENFQCRITVAIDCSAGMFFPNQGCTAGLCGTPPTGACCRSGVCAITLRDDCIGAGGEWYENQPCTAGFCRLGACCTGPLSCVVVTLPGCEQGSWTADGTCVTLFCASAHGSCCRASGVCVVTTPEDCTNGTFIFQGGCTPDPCTMQMGVCCRGTTCAVTTFEACTGAGGTYLGPTATCGPEGNPTTCCPANYNGTGGVTVQDIFDFLAAYFNGDAAADFNGVGGVTVQDIFDFLAAYFAGCP